MRLLLFPFAILYDLVIRLRNRLYDAGYKPSAQFDIPVISVGNLAAGGTGKTPMVQYLIKLLMSRYKVATLSRGYGRRTKGIRIAGEADNATTLGDEPFQFYKNFRNRITVAVGEERALAIPYILHEQPETQVILLDDAFQHRKVKPTFQILLTDYNRPFYQDFVLPAGQLREARSGAGRADVIIVTKCPADLSDDARAEMEKHIRKYSEKPVFFATIHYCNPVRFTNRSLWQDNIVLVSGVANPKPFEQYVKQFFNVVKHVVFKDHHVYTPEDVHSLVFKAIDHDACIVTTEKDAVKLGDEKFRAAFEKISLFYIPIEMQFLKGGKDFNEMIFNVLQHAS